MTADTWGATLISTIWNHVLTLWEHRNKIEHGDTQTLITTFLKQKLMKEV
jgi:hypothetical protein